MKLKKHFLIYLILIATICFKNYANAEDSECLKDELVERVTKTFTILATDDYKTIRPLSINDIKKFKCNRNNTVYLAFTVLDAVENTEVDYSKIEASGNKLFSGLLFNSHNTIKNHIHKHVRQIIIDFSNPPLKYGIDNLFNPSVLTSNENDWEISYIKLVDELEERETFFPDPETYIQVMSYYYTSVWIKKMRKLELGYSDAKDLPCLPDRKGRETSDNCQLLSKRGSTFDLIEYLGTIVKYAKMKNEVRKYFAENIIPNVVSFFVHNPLGFKYKKLIPIVDNENRLSYFDQSWKVVHSFPVPTPSTQLRDRRDGLFAEINFSNQEVSDWDPLKIRVQGPYLSMMGYNKNYWYSDPWGKNLEKGFLNSNEKVVDFQFSFPRVYKEEGPGQERRASSEPVSGLLYHGSNGLTLASLKGFLITKIWLGYGTEESRIIPPKLCNGHDDQLFILTDNHVFAYSHPLKNMTNCRGRNESDGSTCYFNDSILDKEDEDYTDRCLTQFTNLVEYQGLTLALSLDGKVYEKKGKSWVQFPLLKGKNVKILGEPHGWLEGFRDYTKKDLRLDL